MTPARARPPWLRPTLLALLVALTIGALFVGRLAIFSSLAVFLGGLALRPNKKTPGLWAAIAVLATINLLIMVRFTLVNAAPGVVAGGQRAAARLAVSHLREIVFAQDIARERGVVDVDGDGVGAALTMAEMVSGLDRTGNKSAPLLLRFRQHDERLFERDGYLFTLYVPTADGWTATADGIDEEKAERRYVAYAWPMTAGAGHKVVAIDEHERVVWSDNDQAQQMYLGAAQVPAADAALTQDARGFVAEGEAGPDGGVWKRWRKKRGRKRLIGDRPDAR